MTECSLVTKLSKTEFGALEQILFSGQYEFWMFHAKWGDFLILPTNYLHNKLIEN